MENRWKWTALLFAVVLIGYFLATGTSRESRAGLLNPPSQVTNVPVGGLLEN